MNWRDRFGHLADKAIAFLFNSPTKGFPYIKRTVLHVEQITLGNETLSMLNSGATNNPFNVSAGLENELEAF